MLRMMICVPALMLLAAAGCTPNVLPTAHPTEESLPSATPTEVGTPVAVAQSGNMQLEIVRAEADALQIIIEFVLYGAPEELLAGPHGEGLQVDGTIDVDASAVGRGSTWSWRAGSDPGALEGSITYYQHKLLPVGETVDVALNFALREAPVIPTPAATGSGGQEEAMIAATLPAPLAAFSINLALPVTGPFYDIDASQSQTVSDLNMTLLRVWVSPSTVRVVFCPDPSLDREVWTFELIGEFGGEEVHPDYRGDYRHSSDDCTLYDYVRPRGASIQPMTFRMDRLRSVVGPLTQAQIDEANTRLADQGVEIALTEGGPTLVQVPEGMERMDAWKIVFEVLSESIPGPWVFSVDVPQE